MAAASQAGGFRTCVPEGNSRTLSRSLPRIQIISSLPGAKLCNEKDCTLNSTFLLAAALPPGLVSFLPFVVIIAVFYLLLIRPNQNKQKQWQQMLSNLKPGDKVTTTGGIRGVIMSIKDDAIQLRVPPDNIKLEVAKSAIASVTTDEAAK